MDTEQLVHFLDHSDQAAEWLGTLRVRNPQRVHENLVLMTQAGITPDLMAVICSQLEEQVPLLGDPDGAIESLRRFVQATRNPLSFGALVQQEPKTLSDLLQIFSSSQHLGNLLVKDPEAYDLLRLTDGQPSARTAIVDEITSEVRNLTERHAVISALRRYHGRETLRIAYAEVVQQRPLDVVTRQLSWLADAICEGALTFASRDLERQFGTPRRSDGEPARFVVLGLSKLGGCELDYSNDIRLMLLCESDGMTDSAVAKIRNQDYFERLAAEFVKLLSDPADMAAGYRVDVSRPAGAAGPLAIGRDAALRHFGTNGRTWERQAFIKARAVAGSLEMGAAFLQDLEPWVYHRYLNRADVTEIKALKRKLGRHSRKDDNNIWLVPGGIRDVQFVVQFLQLLNGGNLPSIRTGNTQQAIVELSDGGCLTVDERHLLESNYETFRRIEHLVQIMFDLNSHSLPSERPSLEKLASRAGYPGQGAEAIDALRSDLRARTQANQRALDSLLAEAFGEEGETDPAVDLILDPEPTAQSICDVLLGYGFRQIDSAYQSLNSLAEERIPFLSTRRCRHFLSSIAPALLTAISETPDPDATLASLSRVSESLGGKGVLWELFSFNEPSLNLYVRLCAASPYLSTILTSHPGMIDELMDSLILGHLPSLASQQLILEDLCRNADDLVPVLHSFKNAQHLDVGVRDILGKDDIRATTGALSDTGEVCLQKVIDLHYQDLVGRYGIPADDEGHPVELAVMALGKLGGREPNYHSTLDVMLLYEADGMTREVKPSRQTRSTSNQHFFSELAQKTIKLFNHIGPQGRLYELDVTLRARGEQGALAMSLEMFRQHYSSDRCTLSSLQSLCKARPIVGSERMRCLALDAVQQVIIGKVWDSDDNRQIRERRTSLEETAASHNLKRGFGGTVDVEYLVQTLQLRHARNHPSILVAGTIDAIMRLQTEGLLSAEDASSLSDSYRFLRSVEARLRLMNTPARHDLPQDPRQLNLLAYLLRLTESELVERCTSYMQNNREVFERILQSD